MTGRRPTGDIARKPETRTEAYRPSYTPPVDIFETPDAVTLLADMPGVGRDDLDISLEKDVLTIRGRVTEESPKDAELVYAEYRIGDYERSFTVSADIDRDTISAEIKNGVLTLTLPKQERAKPRKITITSE